MAQQATATDDGRANWTRYHKFTKGEKRAEARAERIAASEPETTESPETTVSPGEQATFSAFQSEQTQRDNARAEWEQFRFIDVTEGWVNVANTSHDDPKNHVYSVNVEGGEATKCSCPHDIYRDGKCKHRRAVQNEYI